MTNCSTDLTTYVKQIARYPLLTAEEERSLAETIRNTSLPDEERREAKDRLICCNTRLVMSLAKKMWRRGIEPDDLISAGNIGLERASVLFDPRRGVRFASFAGWHIKRRMRELVRNRFLVHVPAYCQAELSRRSETRGKGHRHDECLEAAQKVINTDGASRTTADGRALVDLLAEDPASDPIVAEELAEHQGGLVSLAFKLMSEREGQIMRMRLWGELTLQQIGDELGITREGVRLIERKVLTKLHKEMADAQ